ncbi:MAG: hypothetical protein V4645_11550 [Pseudomonadota bacterium]
MKDLNLAVVVVAFECWLFKGDRAGLDDLVEALVEAVPKLEREHLTATLRPHLGELRVHETLGIDRACARLVRLILESLE